MKKTNIWDNEELKKLKERFTCCPERTTHVVKLSPNNVSFYFGGDYERSFHPDQFSTYEMNWFEYQTSYGQEAPDTDEIRAVAALTKLEHLLPPKITYKWRCEEKEFSLKAREILEKLPVYSWAEYTRK